MNPFPFGESKTLPDKSLRKWNPAGWYWYTSQGSPLAAVPQDMHEKIRNDLLDEGSSKKWFQELLAAQYVASLLPDPVFPTITNEKATDDVWNDLMWVIDPSKSKGISEDMADFFFSPENIAEWAKMGEMSDKTWEAANEKWAQWIFTEARGFGANVLVKMFEIQTQSPYAQLAQEIKSKQAIPTPAVTPVVSPTGTPPGLAAYTTYAAFSGAEQSRTVSPNGSPRSPRALVPGPG